MTATVTRGGPAAGNTAGNTAGPGASGPRAVRRRRFSFPRASTTPGNVRLTRAGLVLACLAWGALAALMVDQHASAASEAAVTSEPLSLAAQQLYQSLADADVTASTGYLSGRTPPFAYRQRYQADIAAATAAAGLALGPGSAGTLFGRLEADLGAAIRADQAVFAGRAAAGSAAFTGLAAGVAVLALAMAAGCTRGLSRRLAEYR